MAQKKIYPFEDNPKQCRGEGIHDPHLLTQFQYNHLFSNTYILHQSNTEGAAPECLFKSLVLSLLPPVPTRFCFLPPASQTLSLSLSLLDPTETTYLWWYSFGMVGSQSDTLCCLQYLQTPALLKSQTSSRVFWSTPDPGWFEDRN